MVRLRRRGDLQAIKPAVPCRRSLHAQARGALRAPGRQHALAARSAGDLRAIHGVKSTVCLTRYVLNSCTVRQSTSFLGENTDWGWQCWSQETTLDLRPNDQPNGSQRYGPDSARRLRCLGTFTIAPAEPLAVDPAGTAGDVYVPGPGVLRVTPRAGSRRARQQRPAGARRRRPAGRRSRRSSRR